MVVKMDYYQLPNKEDLVDVYHDILLLIHERLPRLMEVYEDKGIMAALSYCKVITEIQGKPTGGVYGKNIKGLLPTIYMDSQVMSDIDNSYNPDEDEIFHMTSPTLIHPAYY